MLIRSTLFCLAVSMAAGMGVSALTLTEEGQSEYVVVVADDAIPAELTAARELQEHLYAITGATLAIQVESSVPVQAKQIVVGPAKRFGEACPDVDLGTLGHDGIVLRTKGSTLYLAGGRPRGSLYAVFSFLEDVAGCRWWTPTEHYVPRAPTLTIPALDTVYVPKLRYREAFYRNAFENKFASRSKCNGHHNRVSEEYGGHYSILGWCHTFSRILPPEQYFDVHPEWYSEAGGKRFAEHSQLCLTNEEMRAEFTRNALARIRKDPGAGIISISQNDWHGWCQCEKCLAVEEEEGSHAGPIIRFVNAVAEDIEKEFPGFLVETLAYSYSRQAPKLVKPRHNVIVRLCSIECSYSQPLSGPQNVTFRQDIEAWSAIAHQLYIWNYVTNFRQYILPHPNMRSLAPNIRFFVDHKAIGLFEQGDSQSTCGDFVELRAWVLAHLMWDPSRDTSVLIDEFLQGYYGPAAEPLRQYIDLLHDTVEARGTYLRCYMEDTAAWLSLEVLNQATQLFNEAAKRVAEHPVLGVRVQRARMPLDHVWLKRYHALKRHAKIGNTPFLGPRDPVTACDEFIQRAMRFNVGSYAEGRPFKDYVPRLKGLFRAPAPAPEICRGLPDTAWLDVQDNEFTLFRYSKYVSLADDPGASDGKTARMTTDHTQWAIQYPVSGDMLPLGVVRCYVVAKCEPKGSSGSGFDAGIYDSKARKEVARKRVSLEATSVGEYQAYDLGAHVLSDTMYVWVAPAGNPEQNGAVCVDRIFFVREEGAGEK